MVVLLVKKFSQNTDGWRHLDLSNLEGENGPLYTDQAFTALGYLWEEGSLPSCIGS